MEGSPSLPRARTAWLLLAILFATLIGLAVTQKRQPKAGESKRPYLAQEATLRVALKQRALVSLFGSLAGSKSMPQVGAIDEATFSSLESSAGADPGAARLFIAAEYEGGRPISAEDLKLLAKSTSKTDQNFAQIYRTKKLGPSSAQDLTRGFPRDDLAFQLARVHAFEKAGDSGPRTQMSPPWKAVGLIVMLMGFFLALPLGALAWVLYFHFRSLGRLQPKGHPAEPLSLPEADRFAYRSVLLIGSFLTIGMLVANLKGLSTPESLFLSYGLMIATVLAVHRIPVLGMDLPLSRIGFTRANLLKNILWGVGGYIAALPCILVAALIGQQLMKIFGQSSHPATELMESSPSATTVMGLLFAAAIAAPFWEEIMFRGTLLPALSRVFGRPIWAILFCSFLFAGIHPQGIPLWLGLGFIGAMNCMLAYQTRSLIPCIVLHMLNNALIILFTVFLF